MADRIPFLVILCCTRSISSTAEQSDRSDDGPILSAFSIYLSLSLSLSDGRLLVSHAMAGGSAVPFLSIPFYNADYDNVQQQQQQPSPYSNKSQRSIEISTLKTLGGHVGLST